MKGKSGGKKIGAGRPREVPPHEKAWQIASECEQEQELRALRKAASKTAEAARKKRDDAIKPKQHRFDWARQKLKFLRANSPEQAESFRLAWNASPDGKMRRNAFEAASKSLGRIKRGREARRPKGSKGESERNSIIRAIAAKHSVRPNMVKRIWNDYRSIVKRLRLEPQRNDNLSDAEIIKLQSTA